MAKHCIYAICGLLLASFTKAQQPDFSSYETTIPRSSISFKMIPIKGGEFSYGSPESETNRKADEGPQRKIKISPFWMEEHEVTYDDFLLFFND